MKDDLFPADAGDDLPPAPANPYPPDVVAAWQLCALLSPIFRSPDNAAGTDTMGGAARFFFAVEFDNNSRRYLADLARLLPREEAVAKARVALLHHLRRCFMEAIRLIDERLAGTGDAPRG